MEDPDKNSLTRRTRYFVDSDVQGALLRHQALCWFAVFGVIASLLLAIESYRGGFTLGFYECLYAMLSHNASLVIAMCIVAPMMIYDSIRMSHRFVGPTVSIRRALKRLGAGHQVEPIAFRKSDYWQDMAENLNLVIDRIDRLEAAQHDVVMESVTVDA